MTARNDLLAQLEAAAAEGLAPNLARFLGFLGWAEGEPLELQALHVPADRTAGRWRDAPGMAAHGSTLASLERLASEADKFKAQGVYLLFNAIDPGVQHRRGPGAWHAVPKGEGTTDRDVTHRRALYIDLDPQRTRGISATAAELLAAADRAARARELLARFIPAETIGAGLSGNGCALFVALAPTPPEGEGERLVKAALVALAGLLDDAAVKVDTSVSDPKRLCFLPGTVKRKGSHSTERPHRRAAFLGPETPRRLTADELRALVTGLRGELGTDEARAAVDAALAGAPVKGARPAPPRPAPSGPAPAPSSAPRPAPAQDGPCRAANEIPVADVAARLGLLDGDRVTCPGCGESDGGVVLFKNGLKCSHNRCSTRGHSAGFRTVVDLVVEREGLDVAGALDWLRREFPGAIPERQRREAQRPPPVAPTPEEPTEPSPPVEPPAPFLPLATSRDLPAFPVGALPDVVGRYVHQLAEHLEVPVDLPATLALGVLASVCMRRFVVQPRPGWTETTNLYLVAALDPGERKTPAFRKVLGPLYAIQKERVETWKKLCKDLVKQRSEEREDKAGKEAKKLEPPPPRPRLFVDDATPEKLAMVLLEQGERITLASDEGGVFQMMTGLYSKSGQANTGVYLKSHDGGQYTVDRMSREALHLEAPAMTMALAVQPEVIRALAKRPDLRGIGLWARFCYCMPASRVGSRTYDAPDVETDVRDHWHRLVKDLDTRARALNEGREEPVTVMFSPEAWRRLHAAVVAIDRAMLPGAVLASVRDWASKLGGLIVRLAGLLHLAEVEEPERWTIDADTVERAIDLGRYFLAHARHVFDVEMSLDPAEQAARQAWEVIQRKGLARVTPGAIGKWVKGLRKTPDAIAALEVLCRQGCLENDPMHRGKGKTYLVRGKGEETDPNRPKPTEYRPKQTKENSDETTIPTQTDHDHEQQGHVDAGAGPAPARPTPETTTPVGLVGLVGIDENTDESGGDAIGIGSESRSVFPSNEPTPTSPPVSGVTTAPGAPANDPPAVDLAAGDDEGWEPLE